LQGADNIRPAKSRSINPTGSLWEQVQEGPDPGSLGEMAVK